MPVDPEAETVPGLPGFPAESAMAPGRAPAEPAAVPVPPPVFGAFLNTAALPSSSSSSSSSAAPGSPLSPAPPTSPGAPHCSGDAEGSEGPLSSLLAAAAARTSPSHPGVCNSAYSPALLAAVGLLPAETLAGWLAHASMGPPFAGLVQELAGASAVPSSDLVFALQSLAAAAPGHAAPAALAAAALCGRLGRPVGLAEAVHTLLLGANYLDPLVAEALVAVYGGSALGAAAALRAASLRWAAGATGGSSGGLRGPARAWHQRRSGPPSSSASLPAALAQRQPQQLPAPSGSSRRSRRYTGADPGSARFRRGLPARADGRALTEQEVLQLAAACGLYTDSRQAFWLFGTNGARIGLALRPLDGGGVINFWLLQAKVTVAGNPDVRERLLEAVLAWTVPWAGNQPRPHAAAAPPPAPGALGAPPALALHAPAAATGLLLLPLQERRARPPAPGLAPPGLAAAGPMSGTKGAHPAALEMGRPVASVAVRHGAATDGTQMEIWRAGRQGAGHTGLPAKKDATSSASTSAQATTSEPAKSFMEAAAGWFGSPPKEQQQPQKQKMRGKRSSSSSSSVDSSE
ncbi:unnamed protein product, partial [Prorocentrum cordatum]